jgi:hypothetical protein
MKNESGMMLAQDRVQLWTMILTTFNLLVSINPRITTSFA